MKWFFKQGDIRKYDDREVIESYRLTGDLKFVGVLFERYAHLVFVVSMKYLKDEDDSKDAVIQIFEKMVIDLKKYEIGTMSTWLHTVARNYCFDKMRKDSRKFENLAELKNEFEMEMIPDTDHIEKEAQIQMLMKGVSSLDITQKQCVELFYLQNKGYEEVASITGYSMNQVKSYIQNGKRNLRIFMTNNNEEFSA